MRFSRLLILTLITLFITASSAVALTGTTYKLMSKLLGDSDPDQYSWNKIFSANPSGFGKNLYLKIYHSGVYQPEQNALLTTAKAYGLTVNEAENVINGSLTPILQQKKQDPGFTQEQALEISSRIQRLFRDISATEKLRGEFNSQSTPTEIFANGDLTDSGFDLVFDLDTIEYYLFVERSPNKVNLVVNPGNTDFQSSPVKLDRPQSNTAFYDTQSSGLGSSVASDGKSTANSPQGSAKSGGATSGDSSGSPRLLKDLPAGLLNDQGQICPPNPGLQNAAENSTPVDDTSPGGDKRPHDGNSGDHDNPGRYTGDTPSVDIGDGASLPPPTDTPTGSQTAKLTPAPNNFPKDTGFCNDLKGKIFQYPSEVNAEDSLKMSFCFGISTSSAVYTTFYPEKPCILCTVSLINEAFRKTVSHSLVPSKLTGNIFESAKCKSGYNLGSVFDMNVFVVPMPILTPPKYSAYEGHDVSTSFDLFAKQYLPFSSKVAPGEKSSEKSTDLISREDDDTLREKQAVTQCLAMSPRDVSQTDLLDCVSNIVQISKGRQQESIQNMRDAVDLEVSTDLYQPLIAELRRMGHFFTSFKILFDEVSSTTCPNLANKDSE
jgi:hypothetical protein